MVGTGIKRLHQFVRANGSVKMRNRRAGLLRIGSIHLNVTGWMNSGCQGSTCRDHVRTDPVEIFAVLTSGDPFLVGHLGIDCSGAMVFQVTREGVIKPE